MSSENEIKKIGSKHDVFYGKALRTSGGLKKGDLMLNKNGKVVSIKKYEQGLKAFNNIKSFVKNPDELKELRKNKKTKSMKDEIKEEEKTKEEKKEEMKTDITMIPENNTKNIEKKNSNVNL